MDAHNGHDEIGEKMSAIEMNRVQGGVRQAGFGSKLWAAVSNWNDARMTRNALNRLTDRELNDIGLQRADIESVARR